MAEMQTPAGAQPATGQQPLIGPTLRIEKIYVKDLSLENPGAPQSFNLQETPQVEVSLRSRGEQLEEGLFECVLVITVTAKSGDKTLFLVEATQAGLFRINGVPMSDIQPILGVHCPQVLFPYIRETIAEAIMRTGFPPVHLDPINFETLYQQQLAALQQQQQPQPQVAAQS
jgi:preprotein translocase subunit SecB